MDFQMNYRIGDSCAQVFFCAFRERKKETRLAIGRVWERVRLRIYSVYKFNIGLCFVLCSFFLVRVFFCSSSYEIFYRSLK